MQIGFDVDALDVRIRGTLTDEQLLGDALLGMPERVERQHLDLALGD